MLQFFYLTSYLRFRPCLNVPTCPHRVRLKSRNPVSIARLRSSVRLRVLELRPRPRQRPVRIHRDLGHPKYSSTTNTCQSFSTHCTPSPMPITRLRLRGRKESCTTLTASLATSPTPSGWEATIRWSTSESTQRRKDKSKKLNFAFVKIESDNLRLTLQWPSFLLNGFIFCKRKI